MICRTCGKGSSSYDVKGVLSEILPPVWEAVSKENVGEGCEALPASVRAEWRHPEEPGGVE